MEYKIITKFQKGDTIYYHSENGIVFNTVNAVHALLRADGSYEVFYGVEEGKYRYKRKIDTVIEEALAYSTPEEVANSLVVKLKQQIADKEQSTEQ